ncbi:MAG: chromate transporter [Proteobacteria bacterium]|nr:chromate transporter [Pseudomonadota bacterium]HQR04584.1 chromate transporter [Rhodocyclaceae bacterium]
MSTLILLAVHIAALGLMAFGGASAVMPELQRLVIAQHWMDVRTFNDLFAIAQGAPGPNLLIFTLVGWQVAGASGAITATIAFCAPSGLLAYTVGQIWQRHHAHPWRIRIQAGLLPLTVGLVTATAWILARSANQDLSGWILTGLTLGIVRYSRLPPVLLLFLGGIYGMAVG